MRDGRVKDEAFGWLSQGEVYSNVDVERLECIIPVRDTGYPFGLVFIRLMSKVNSSRRYTCFRTGSRSL